VTTCKHGITFGGSCADCYSDRRDRFAAAALTGLLANNGRDGSALGFTGDAVLFADALIAALDKLKEA
jgi:hypothetical protein